MASKQNTPPNNKATVELHVIPFRGLKKVAKGGKSATHTIESFARDVIQAGATYTMVHQYKRWPKDIPTRPDLARGVTTPRIKENFVSRQELTGDDDRKIDGVVTFWLNDAFFSRYGALFAESSSSKPGAEKGHPVLIFDAPIVDQALYEECLRAFNHRYDGKTDQAIKSCERLVYNKPGAKIHMLGNVCPFDVFKAAILIPYRQYVAQQKQLAAAKAERQKREGTTKSGDAGNGFARRLADFASMSAGDNRHLALYNLARHTGGSLPSEVLAATKKNEYYADHAHTDQEVARVWKDGARLHQAPPQADPLPQTITKTAQLLDRDFMMRYEMQRRGDMSPGELAGELLGHDAIMVAPARSHYSGDFPDTPLQKSCGTKWVNDLYEYASNPGQGHVKARGAVFAVVHSYMTKSGMLIAACPHCIHDKAVKMCRHIVRASEQYTRENLMRHALVSDKEAKRLGELVKKRNQRAADGITLSLVKIPQAGGQTYILHDVPDLAGELMPSDKSELYKLVHSMVTNSAEGRRGWRGLASWGVAGVAVRENKKGGRTKENSELKFVARIMGENFGKYATLLRGYLDIDDPITKRKGIDFDVDLSHFLTFLEGAGLDYAVIEGDLSRLTQKTKEYCTKRDTGGVATQQRLNLYRSPAEIAEEIPGF